MFHKACFGTLIRFLPLFDFPNNDSKIVFITDADLWKKSLPIIYDIINK